MKSRRRTIGYEKSDAYYLDKIYPKVTLQIKPGSLKTLRTTEYTYIFVVML